MEREGETAREGKGRRERVREHGDNGRKDRRRGGGQGESKAPPSASRSPPPPAFLARVSAKKPVSSWWLPRPSQPLLVTPQPFLSSYCPGTF